MICPKCGAQIADDSKFCTECGKIIEQAVPVVAEPMEAAPVYQPVAEMQPTQKKKKKGALIGGIAGIIGGVGAGLVALITIIVIIAVAVGASNKANLQNELLRDWQRVEHDSTYYTLRLDFQKTSKYGGDISYDFDGTYVDDNIANYTYKVISKDKVEIDGNIYLIEISDSGNMMTMTPALTSSASYEYWYNWDGTALAD